MVGECRGKLFKRTRGKLKRLKKKHSNHEGDGCEKIHCKDEFVGDCYN